MGRELGGDHVGDYLRQIGPVQFLTHQDEVRLALAIRQGRAASARLVTGGLESSRETELKGDVREGINAFSTFTKSNLPLVVSIATRHRREGVDPMDLIQAGNLALMKAVEKFDPDLGFKFSTYATWWIRGAIKREVKKWTKGGGATSLDERAYDGDGPELHEMIEDLQATAVMAGVEDRAIIASHLNLVEPKEAEVLRQRYGLAGPAMDLNAIGENMGFTFEYIRQLEAIGINKIQKTLILADLDDTLGNPFSEEEQDALKYHFGAKRLRRGQRGPSKILITEVLSRIYVNLDKEELAKTLNPEGDELVERVLKDRFLLGGSEPMSSSAFIQSNFGSSSINAEEFNLESRFLRSIIEVLKYGQEDVPPEMSRSGSSDNTTEEVTVYDNSHGLITE